MWKKIFFGGAKAFANDASRIVGKEMTRRAKERNNEEYNSAMELLNNDEPLSSKKRSVYFNEMKRIIIKQSRTQERLLEIFKDILEQIYESDDVVVAFNDEEEVMEILKRESEAIQDRAVEYEFLMEAGDEHSKKYDDYGIHHFCKRRKETDDGLLLLIESIEELFINSCDPEYLSGELNGDIESFTFNVELNLDSMNEDFESMTDANKPFGMLNGESHQYDYNDYDDEL